MDMKNKWSHSWKNIVGVIIVSVILVIGTTIVGRTAISELVGLAVAQTNTLWNNVADAAKGDGLTSGIMAQSSYLFNGITFDRLRGAPAADGVAGTGLQASVIALFNGTTYDRMRGGLAADASAVTGLINNAQMLFNSATYDRMRTASGDALPITGIQGSGQLLWNGVSNDRQRSASVTNNTSTTSLGGTQVTQLSTWVITNTPATAVQATASKAAGGGTVRHVITSISVCLSTTTATTPLIINLRDGATGAGTVLQAWTLSVPANDSQCIPLAPLNISGSANTAMTIEFAAAGAVTSQETVSATGYSTP